MTIYLLYLLGGIGALSLLGILLVMLRYAFESFLNWDEMRRIRRYEGGRQYALYQLGQDAYWFSEDSTTYQLLNDLSKGRDVSVIREEWRRRKAGDLAEAMNEWANHRQKGKP